MWLLRIMALVAFGLCLTMKAQSAEAHAGHAATQYSAPGKAVSSPGISAQEQVSVLSSQQDENGCQSGCCTLVACCCVAVTPHSQEVPEYPAVVPVQGTSVVPLPQGPPYQLLRPPKFSV